MNLLGYTGHEIESEVRAILRARGTPHPSIDACRKWARAFVRGFAPFYPDVALTDLQAQTIGREFIKELSMARGRPTLAGLPSRALQQALEQRDAEERDDD